MNQSLSSAQDTAIAHLQIRRISLDHPWQWLASGWSDLRRAPKYSLTYGSFFTLVSALLTIAMFNRDLFFVIPPLAAGFFLVAPLLGIGLYRISESLELGEKPEFCEALRAWNRNEIHLAGMGVTLMLILLVWLMAANLVFALLFSKPVPNWENFFSEVFFSGSSPLFLFTGILVGALIAAFTFSISVISVPLMMDRQIDLVTAMQTSLRAVRTNLAAMGLWAVLIVVFVGIGLASGFVGLAVTMPLIGHATWHAYRDLVEA